MSGLNMCIDQTGKVVPDLANLGVFPVYSDHNKTVPARYINMAELVKMAATPAIGSRGNAAALTPYQAKAKTKAAAQASEYHALVIDHDKDKLSADQVRQIYRGYELHPLIYTTSSHTPEAPRYKVVIAFDHPIPFWKFTELAVGAARLLGTDKAQSKDAQIFYAPNKLTRDSSYEYFDDTEGRPLDPLNEAHPFIAACADSYLDYAEEKEKVAQQAASKPRTISQTEGSIIDKVCAQYNIADELRVRGYEQIQRNLFLSPQSSSGSPGVHILTDNDGKQRVYSHHGETDPLSNLNNGGHALDVFDVICTLDFKGDTAVAVRELAKKVDPEGQKERQREYAASKSKARKEAEPSIWPELADLFALHPAPSFPLDILPEAFRVFCTEKSAQSGFDIGGYGYCLLMAAANTIDHRHKLNIGPFRVPAFSWGGLVADSGGGKSPLLSAITPPVEKINSKLIRQSKKALAKWLKAVETAKSMQADPPPKPAWKQRHALDTTTEALAQLLSDNPEGINMYHHEITEFLGRMDAYAGKDGGKDRGVFLRAYDGGQVTINRASKPMPQVVDDFSVGILAGIQPEILAQKFKLAGAGADGLYQRFSMYCLAPAGQVDYMATENTFTEINVELIFDKLHGWHSDKPWLVELGQEAKLAMQGYHNHVRTLAQRTNAKRFAEHLDKFPGMLGRFAFALHVLEAAANDTDPQQYLKPETMQKARRLMAVLYRHSESVYQILDQEAGQVRALVRSAAEAVLSKGWQTFNRGDLTRNATYWQGADNREAESAIDYLIELGWIIDVTPPTEPGKRGRRSAGRFLVNPQVHERFSEYTTRIKEARAERFEAIKQVTEAN